jgi:hypothetical protein
LPFFSAIARHRVPPAESVNPTALRPVEEATGWLGTTDDWTGTFAGVWPFATFLGDRGRAPWLPDESVAAAWRAYVTHNSPVRIESPPAIRVGADPKEGQDYALAAPGLVEVRVTVMPGPNVASVEVLDGAATVARGQTAPFVFAPRLAPGLHPLSAVAVDADGRRYVSKLHTVLVR